MQYVEAQQVERMNRGPAADEQELINRIAAGDRKALAQLYDRYQRPLFRYLCQLTPDRGLAEEILQDTILAVWQGATGFEGRSTLQTWLIGVARRQAHNSMRRKGLPLAGTEELDEIADSGFGPEGQALAAAGRETLTAAMNRLALIHREVLALVFVQGLSYSEAATVLDIPEGTVKSRLSNARRALKAVLGSREAMDG